MSLGINDCNIFIYVRIRISEKIREFQSERFEENEG